MTGPTAHSLAPLNHSPQQPMWAPRESGASVQIWPAQLSSDLQQWPSIASPVAFSAIVCSFIQDPALSRVMGTQA